MSLILGKDGVRTDLRTPKIWTKPEIKNFLLTDAEEYDILYAHVCIGNP